MKLFLRILLLVIALFSHHLHAMCNDQIQKNYELFEAIRKSNLPEIIAALKNGAKPNARHFMGKTALALAIRGGNSDIVQYLLDNGAFITNVDRVKSTALEYAVDCGHAHLIPLLVAYGADCNHVDAHGYTPLVWAANKGDQNVITMLLLNDAHITNDAISHASNAEFQQLCRADQERVRIKRSIHCSTHR